MQQALLNAPTDQRCPICGKPYLRRFEVENGRCEQCRKKYHAALVEADVVLPHCEEPPEGVRCVAGFHQIQNADGLWVVPVDIRTGRPARCPKAKAAIEKRAAKARLEKTQDRTRRGGFTPPDDDEGGTPF